MPAGEGTWRDLLVAAQEWLEQAGIEEADVKLRWVAGHLLACGLLDVRRHAADIPTPILADRFQTLVDRLATDEPVQYVIGETDFMGLRIRCDARALIPRPETELLAGCALDFLRHCPGQPAVVDVGTGTGCLACVLALRAPRARVVARDISLAALELARANAQALGAAVEFEQADLLAELAPGSVDLVVANPPYVATAECDRLPRTVRDFEPRLALDGGADGLRAISRLVSGAADVLSSDGQLMMEIGEDQADAVAEMVCRTPPIQPISLKSDFAGRARVAIWGRPRR